MLNDINDDLSLPVPDMTVEKVRRLYWKDSIFDEQAQQESRDTSELVEELCDVE